MLQIHREGPCLRAARGVGKGRLRAAGQREGHHPSVFQPRKALSLLTRVFGTEARGCEGIAWEKLPWGGGGLFPSLLPSSCAPERGNGSFSSLGSPGGIGGWQPPAGGWWWGVGCGCPRTSLTVPPSRLSPAAGPEERRFAAGDPHRPAAPRLRQPGALSPHRRGGGTAAPGFPPSRSPPPRPPGPRST